MKYSISVILIFIFMSCASDNEQETPDRGTYISGIVDSKAENYQQVNFENVNTSNTFFSNSKETWLQAYENKDETSTGGHWRIRIHDLDILKVSLPYSDWSTTRASIAWDNNLTDKDNRCGGIDAGCEFIGSTEKGMKLIIKSVTNNYIEGEFSGRFYLTGVGFSRFRDEDTYVNVNGGNFRIKFSLDDN